MHAEEPHGKQVNTCQLYSHLGNSSIFVHGCQSDNGQSDNTESIFVMYVYAQCDKYIHHATSKPIIILDHKI